MKKKLIFNVLCLSMCVCLSACSFSKKSDSNKEKNSDKEVVVSEALVSETAQPEGVEEPVEVEDGMEGTTVEETPNDAGVKNEIVDNTAANEAEDVVKAEYIQITKDSIICTSNSSEVCMPQFYDSITDNLGNHHAYGFRLKNSTIYTTNPGEAEFLLKGEYSKITFSYVPSDSRVVGGTPELIVYADNEEILYVPPYEDVYVDPVEVTLDVTGVERIRFHIPSGSTWTSGPNGEWYILEPKLYY